MERLTIVLLAPNDAALEAAYELVWEMGASLSAMQEQVKELEGQTAATELAVRALVDNPLNPATAAAEARDILRVLEG